MAKTKKSAKKKTIKKKIMSGKEMYERNPFSSSFSLSLWGKKKNAKEATIRGTPFHTQSSTYPQTVKWHVLSKKKEKKRSHCLFATFPKSNVLQCTPPKDFCVGFSVYWELLNSKKNEKKKQKEKEKEKEKETKATIGT